MNEQVKQAIIDVINQYYSDESKHFQTCSDEEKENHIFNSLELLKKQVGLN